MVFLKLWPLWNIHRLDELWHISSVHLHISASTSLSLVSRGLSRPLKAWMWLVLDDTLWDSGAQVCVCICCVSEIVSHLVLTKEWGALQGQSRELGGGSVGDKSGCVCVADKTCWGENRLLHLSHNPPCCWPTLWRLCSAYGHMVKANP